MKKITVTALISLAGFLTAGSAVAQTAHEIRVSVPFAFAVDNKVLPAGDYRIDSETSPISANEVLIQNVDHPRFAVLVRGSDGPWEVLPTSVADRGSLVFNQYGDDRFLREVRGPVAAVNVDIPISRAEQHVQKRDRKALASPSETTISIGN
jgi:hypothetical protein